MPFDFVALNQTYSLLGDEGQELLLNQELLTEKTYTDSGYDETLRRYTIKAVDHNDAESLGRAIVLPVMEVFRESEKALQRGVMNSLSFRVENRSETLVENVRLRVKLAGRNHLSEEFSVDPQSAVSVPVVVGGYAEMADPSHLAITIEITPNPGEKVEIVSQVGPTTSSSPSPVSSTISGAKCLPTAERPEPACDPCKKRKLVGWGDHEPQEVLGLR